MILRSVQSCRRYPLPHANWHIRKAFVVRCRHRSRLTCEADASKHLLHLLLLTPQPRLLIPQFRFLRLQSNPNLSDNSNKTTEKDGRKALPLDSLSHLAVPRSTPSASLLQHAIGLADEWRLLERQACLPWEASRDPTHSTIL